MNEFQIPSYEMRRPDRKISPQEVMVATQMALELHRAKRKMLETIKRLRETQADISFRLVRGGQLSDHEQEELKNLCGEAEKLADLLTQLQEQIIGLETALETAPEGGIN